MTSWQYATSESFVNVSGFVDLSFVLSRQVIAVDVASSQKKATWDKAGNILQIIDQELLEGFSTRLEVSDSFNYLGFTPTLYKFQILSGNPYRLRIKPVPWLTNFSVTVWQYLET
jgi:hypothetical protein